MTRLVSALSPFREQLLANSKDEIMAPFLDMLERLLSSMQEADGASDLFQGEISIASQVIDLVECLAVTSGPNLGRQVKQAYSTSFSDFLLGSLFSFVCQFL
jgi:hypothetical protein